MENPERMFTIFPGRVVNAEDPEGRLRSQVEVPGALGEKEAVWAEACTAPGSSAVPASGQAVWVMFKGGDVKCPVWLGVPGTAVDELSKHRHLLVGLEGSGKPAGPDASKLAAKFIGGITVIFAALILDHWLFRALFDVSYIDWYLATGALIAIVTSLVATAWTDIDTDVGLIAANPWVYVGSNFQRVGISLYSLGSLFLSGHEGRRGGLALDWILAIPWTLVVSAFLLGWLLIVVPIQYFVILLSGGPARLAIRSRYRSFVSSTVGWRLTIADQPKVAGTPQGWWEVGLFRKPVTSTNVVASGLLFALKSVV